MVKCGCLGQYFSYFLAAWAFLPLYLAILTLLSFPSLSMYLSIFRIIMYRKHINKNFLKMGPAGHSGAYQHSGG